MSAIQPGSTFYYYTVLGELGAGFHGEVYEIRHNQTGAVFALKVIHTQDRALPNRVERALAAAKGNYRVEHRNVLLVHDLNCEPDGLVWMRTERLYGKTLRQLLYGNSPVSLPFAIQAAIQAAHGLQAIHEAQIIHRDVKPSNLFYTRDRMVKVIDFSIAKVFPEGLQTTAGRVGMGTPAYMAPEQLIQAHARPDPRFDIYSLGISLWEMLVGRSPFDDCLRNPEALIRAQVTRLPARLAEIAGLPPEVDAVLAKALAKDPAKRFGSMAEFARELTELQNWLAAEVCAGRLFVTIPLGEPPMPGDPNAWRDYRPPRTVPPHELAPPSGPKDRVIVAGGARSAVPEAGRALLGGTQPLPPQPPRAASDSTPATHGARQPAATTKASPVFGETGSSSSGARETPAPTIRFASVPPPTPRRMSWYAVIAAVMVASSGAATLAWWARPARPPSAMTSTASAPPAAPPLSTPATVLVPEGPGITPAATAGPPAPTAAPAPEAASAPVKPPSIARPERRAPVPGRQPRREWPSVAEPPPPTLPTHRVFGEDL